VSLLWVSCNFLISNPFLTIFSASDVSKGGIEISFGHQNQQSAPRPPLRDSACPECLSVHSHTILPYSNNKFKENLQNLQILSPLPQVTVNNKSKKKRKNTTQPACIIALY
jgi:hypothetical protein